MCFFSTWESFLDCERPSREVLDVGWGMIDRAAKGAGKVGRAGEGSALCQIKSLSQWGSTCGWTDRQPLEQFASRRDASAEAAFAALNLAYLLARAGRGKREEEAEALRQACITRPDERLALPSDP